jgi:tripartite-type tricarboxylate transporter receptor subunit TctC
MTMHALCHFTRPASTKGLSLLACLLVAAAQLTTPAQAQEWPTAGRNIRLIVPSPGGSGTGDTIARIAAEEMGKRL